MRSQRWRLRAAVTGAAVVALVAATGPTGSATPVTSAPGGSATPPQSADTGSAGETALPTTDSLSDGGTGSTRVTLITGDVVSYSPGVNGGKPTVEVTSSRHASFTQVQEDGHHYVFPGDTRALVGAGKLDKMLFDVAYLAENGYSDDNTTQLSVIVQYPKPSGSSRSATPPASSSAAKALSTKADALPATTHVTGLPVVNSAAVKVTKADATKFWSSVDAPKPNTASLDAGVAKIWLDKKVKTSLDVSVPQIGAPEAWAAGYDGTGITVAVLDTGIDDTHPDLAGKITESKSFIDGETTKDGFGHGTHVASTIVGSGAASGGKYKGVAPGAKLIVGKVLADNGFGSDSQIIAGMQWAAESGARIVSMSLGGCCSDGTDPMAQAVNDLTAQYGTLFVIAAGNNGPTAGTINSPGAADAALTVAAVDRQDQMASFSGRGPRLSNFGLKPDIAGPGVNIVAARAEGTTMPGAVHVGDRYTTVSGTSMATPHVAGSAVILAQEHPDWSGQKIKQVLVSTSKDVGHSAYEQGAGRVDIPRATTQQVYATSNVDFGRLAWPHTVPVSRPLTYVNDGDSAVTLDLTATATSTGPVPDGLLTVSPSTLTVPAHGTAEATVTLDVTKNAPNTTYGGAVHAVSTDGAVTVNTAVGGRKQARQVRITANIIDRPEATDMVYFGYSLTRLDDRTQDEVVDTFTGPNRTESVMVDAGVYSVSNDVSWRDSDGEWNRAMFTNPNVDATGDGDVTVTFDLRRAVPEVARTPKPSVPYYKVFGQIYLTDAGRGRILEYRLPYGADKMWSLPSSNKATHGTFTGYSTYYNGIDPVKMSIHGQGNTDLHPLYQSVNRNVAGLGTKVTMLNLHGRVQLVDAGAGRPEDFARVDARGRIALLDLSEFCPPEPPTQFGSFCTSDAMDRVENAKDAGAVAVLGYGTVGRQFLLSLSEVSVFWVAPTYPIPTMGLTAKEGRMLAARLARGPVTLDVDATEFSPYLYPLTWVRHDHMPAGIRTVTDRDLLRTDHRLHTDTPGTPGNLFYSAVVGTGGTPKTIRAYQIARTAPFTVTTYTGPLNQDAGWISQTNGQGYSERRSERIVHSGARTQDWGAQPLVPTAYRGDPSASPYETQYCSSCRNGDVLSTQHVLSHDGTAAGPVAYGSTADGPVTSQRLYRADGTEIPRRDGYWWRFLTAFYSPYFELPQSNGTYRMTEDYQSPIVAQKYARTVQTERTFTSQRRDDGFARIDGSSLDGSYCSGWFLHQPDEAGTRYVPIDPDSPCSASNELYLGYDFNLNLDNTLPAGTRQSVKVTGFGSPYLPTQPKLTQVTLSLSYDDGKTWQKVKTKPNHDGTFNATFDQPALSKTTGAVSVRAEATDSNGNTVRQTITHAYGLTAAPVAGHAAANAI